MTFSAVVDDGSELAQQLMQWRDAVLGTGEEREMSRLPHLFTVMEANYEDPACGHLAHCAAMVLS
jgi:hypothetical protein